MASKPSQDDEPVNHHHNEFLSGSKGLKMRDMTATSMSAQTLFFDSSTLHDGAVRNTAVGGSPMTVNMGYTASPPPQPRSTRSASRQSHSRSSSSTRPTVTRDRSPAPSYEAPANTLGAEPRNPYGSRRPGHHQHESTRTPRDSSAEGRRGSGVPPALARDAPLHPQPNGLTPPHLASPGLESLSGFDVPSRLRGPSSLGGGDELSPEDSMSVALRPPEETEADSGGVPTPPAPQAARSDVEERVQPPTPTVPEVAEQPFPDLRDGVQAEQPKDLLEVERSTALDQGTPASGLLSLESPSRVHFNSGPSFDDQSSISDESEPDAEALARANAAAPEKKPGVGNRIRLWLSRKLEGLARRVAPTGV